MSDLNDFLQRTPISVLLENHRPLISLPSTCLLDDVMTTLHNEGISSLPIYDEQNGSVIGIVDMFEIIIFLLKIVGVKDVPDIGSIPISFFQQLELSGQQLGAVPILHVMRGARTTPPPPAVPTAVFGTTPTPTPLPSSSSSSIVSILSTASLTDLISIFETGTERVVVLGPHPSSLTSPPLFSESGEVIPPPATTIVGLLSQSDLISGLSGALRFLGIKAKRDIGGLDMISQEFVAEPESRPVLHILHDMYRNSATAVCVVNPSNQVVANLSISDLNCLNRGNLEDTLLSVREFLRVKSMGYFEHKPRTYFDERDGDVYDDEDDEDDEYDEDDDDDDEEDIPYQRQPLQDMKSLHPIVCTVNDTFETVVMKLVSTRVHRLWVVDSYARPVGVVSISSLTRQFLYGSMECISEEEASRSAVV